MPIDLFRDIPEPATPAITDHGGLTGLSDDDHSQYIHNAPATSARNLITAAGGYQGILNLKRGAGGSPSDVDLFSLLNNNDSHLFRVFLGEFGDNRLQSSLNLWLDNRSQLRFYETASNGSNYIALRAPSSLGSDLTFTLPSAYGTSGHFLQSDGSGGLTFAAASASPGGSDTQLQFNDGGSFGGDSDLVWNKTTNALAVNGSVSIAAGSLGSPSLSASGDSDTGMYFSAADTINFGCGGTGMLQLSTEVRALGRVRGVTGTAASPSYSFTGDTDTGVYRIGANEIGFSAGGSLAMSILNSSGLSTSIYTSLHLTNGTNYVGFALPTLSGNTTYTLPAADGTSGQALTTNGSGALSWSTISGGAPTNAEYIVRSANGSLSNEWVLTAGTGIGVTYSGGNATVAVGSSVMLTTNAQTILAAKNFGSNNCRIDDSGGTFYTQLSSNATSNRSVTFPDAAGTVLTTASDDLITVKKTFLLGVHVGVGESTPQGTVHVSTDTTEAIPCVYLEQSDIDQPFIEFDGTSAADQSRSLSSDTTGWTEEGYIRIKVNGVTKWIPYGDF